MKIMQVTGINPNWKEAKATIKLFDTNFNNGKKFIYEYDGITVPYVTDSMLQSIQSNQNLIDGYLTDYETTIQSHINTKGYTIPGGTLFTTLQGQYDAILNSEITAFVDENSPTIDMNLLSKIVDNEKNFADRRVNILRVLNEMRTIIFETYKVSETLYSNTLDCNGAQNETTQTISFTSPTTKLIKNIVLNYKSEWNSVEYDNENIPVSNTTYTQTYAAMKYTENAVNFDYTLDGAGLTDTITMTGSHKSHNDSGNVLDVISNIVTITADTYLKTVTAGDLDEYIHKNIYDSDFNFDFVTSFEV